MAVALGEIDPADAVIDNLLRRTDLFSRRGMVFSGTETRSCEAIVIGQPAGSTSGLQLHCGVVDDLLDIEGMAAIMAPDANASIDAARARSGDVVAAFFKAGVRQDGLVRGRRTTVFSSDLDPDKHMRAAASGVVASTYRRLPDVRFGGLRASISRWRRCLRRCHQKLRVGAGMRVVKASRDPAGIRTFRCA